MSLQCIVKLTVSLIKLSLLYDHITSCCKLKLNYVLLQFVSLSSLNESFTNS
jgi:hypothetical protein